MQPEWKLTIVREYKGTGYNTQVEVRYFRTHRGAVQSGNYWMLHDPHVIEYEVVKCPLLTCSPTCT